MRDKTPGHPRTLVVDLTRDKKQFEHDMTLTICNQLRERGVELTSNSPVFVQTIEEYEHALNDLAGFNCLLLVTHGGKDKNDGTANKVVGPFEGTDWYSLAILSEPLKDKFVMLAVCHGYCEDSIAAFTQEGSWALSLLGSEVSLTKNEAIAFFPAFLEELSGSCLESIDPVQIRDALYKTNGLAGNKMRFVRMRYRSNLASLNILQIKESVRPTALSTRRISIGELYGELGIFEI
jgi:hypothetical protein